MGSGAEHLTGLTGSAFRPPRKRPAQRPLDTWRSRHESKVVLDRLESVMKLAGGGLEHVVNLLQTFDGRGQTAADIALGRGMEVVVRELQLP